MRRRRPSPPALTTLRRPSFARFWLASLVSNLGTWMQNLAVPFALLQTTGSPAWVGFGAFAQLCPSVLSAPLGGALADRLDRRKLLVVSLLAQAATAVLLAVAWHWSWPPALFVVVVAVSGGVFGATVPMWYSCITDLVPPEELRGAVTVNSAQFNSARAAGPAIGGLALAAFGPGAAFLLNAAAYLVSIALVLRVVVRRRDENAGPPPGGFWAEMAGGARIAWRHRELAIALGLVLATAFLAMPISQLLAVFARDVYDVGPGAFGLLAALYGVGAVFGAVVLVLLERRWRLTAVLQGGLFVFSASMLAFAAMTHPVPAGVFLFTSGMGLVATTSSLNSSIQLRAPGSHRGRLLALYSAALTAGLATGALLQGALAGRFGIRPVVAVAALAYVGLAVAVRASGVARRLAPPPLAIDADIDPGVGTDGDGTDGDGSDGGGTDGGGTVGDGDGGEGTRGPAGSPPDRR